MLNNRKEEKYLLKKLKKAGKILGISLAASATISACGLSISMHNAIKPRTNNKANIYSQLEVTNDYIPTITSNELNTYDTETPKIPIELNSYSQLNMLNTLKDSDYSFKMAEYYGLDQILEHYNNTIVNKSNTSNLLTNEKLDTDKLIQQVLLNNKECFANGKNSLNIFYKDLENSDIKRLCELISEVVNNNYSNEEIKNIANTLTKLTMFKRTGTAASAYVSDSITFVYNPTMTNNYAEIKEIEGKKQEDTKKGVIMHEIYHLIQYASNDIENKNGIESGMCRMYNLPGEEKKVPVDSLWYPWLLEASAEINMAKQLNIEPGTYQKKISYVRSYNLSKFNEIEKKEQSLENAVFNYTLEDAFSDLNLKTKEEQQEFLKFMYSIEIAQSDPDSFWEYYKLKTGETPTDKEKTNIRMNIRAEAVKYLSGQFYENLTNSIYEGKIKDLNTVFYLVRTWELDAYSHLEYTKTTSLEPAKDFIKWHDQIQKNLFKEIAESNNIEPTKIINMYNEYNLQVETANNEIKDNCDLSNFNGYMQYYISNAKNKYSTENFSRNREVLKQIEKDNNKNNIKIQQKK